MCGIAGVVRFDRSPEDGDVAGTGQQQQQSSTGMALRAAPNKSTSPGAA